MKTVLCFGDSMTYGLRPDADARHAREDRWPVVLGRALGPGVEVIAEGLRGRLTAFDGPLRSCDRNGARILPVLLDSHAPLDLIVIMLGGNDIFQAELSPRLSAEGTRHLIELVRAYPYPGGVPAPKILIAAPPRACAARDGSVPATVVEGVAGLAAAQRSVADRMGCAFFDTSVVAQPSPIDGCHCDAANTRAIGEALAPVVAGLLA